MAVICFVLIGSYVIPIQTFTSGGIMNKGVKFLFALFGAVMASIFLPLSNVEAATPRAVFGIVQNSDGSTPAVDDVSFTAFIQVRSDETITETDPGPPSSQYVVSDGVGGILFNIGSFASNWSEGETLQIDIENSANGQTATVEEIIPAGSGDIDLGTIVLSGNGGQTATRFEVTTSATDPQQLGLPFDVVVTAKDDSNDTVTDYAGNIQFSSTDVAAVLPADDTFGGTEGGTKTYSVILNSAGEFTVTVDDGTINGISGPINVLDLGGAVSFEVTADAADPQPAGTAFNITVTAKNASDGTVNDYAGTIEFTSTDTAADLPSTDLTFDGTEGGTKTFSVTLNTGGSWTVSVSDGPITGTSPAINVEAAAVATQFSVTTDAADPQPAGTAFNVTVTAQDAGGATVTDYAGNIQFSSTDVAAVLPADDTFDGTEGGTKTYSVTLNTEGSWTVSVSDGTISGSSATINVGAAGTKSLLVTGGSGQTATAGTALANPIQITVTENDAPVTGQAANLSANADPASPAAFAFTETSDGVYQTSWTLANATGLQRLFISLADFPDAEVAALATCDASAKFSVTSIEGLVVNLEVANTANIASYAWDFAGGAQSGTDEAPILTFPTEGTKTISLTVTSDSGCQSEFALTVNLQGIVDCSTVVPADFDVALNAENSVAPVVTVDASALAGVAEYLWSFDEPFVHPFEGGNLTPTQTGGTDEAPEFTYSYDPTTDSPIQSITLTVVYASGCQTTITRLIPIDLLQFDNPDFFTLGFSATPTRGALGTTVKFANVSFGTTILLSAFTPEGNGPLEAPADEYTYGTGGEFQAEMFIVLDDGDGSEFTATLPISISALDFSGTPRIGFAPLTVDFTDETVGPTVSGREWLFGDGNSDLTDAANPQHEYTVPGTYDVTFRATLDGADPKAELTKYGYIVVEPNPECAIQAGFLVPEGIQATIPATFDNDSFVAEGETVQWTWETTAPAGLGEATIVDPNAEHAEIVFPDEGTYTVRLIAQGDSCADAFEASVTVGAAPPCDVTAAFDAPAPPINPGIAVVFANTSDGEGRATATWQWEVTPSSAGATIANPAAENATITFPSVGTYTVGLTAFGDGCENTFTLDVEVTLCDVAANFTASATSVNTGATVNFTNASEGDAVDAGTATYLWQVLSGATQVAAGTAEDFSHTFNGAGTFTVRLTATGADNCTSVKSLIVSVTTPGGGVTPPPVVFPPVANFTVEDFEDEEVVEIVAGTILQFLDTSTGGASYLWNFGDDATSTQRNPTHAYDEPGTFDVSLRVGNAGGFRTATKDEYVVVTPLAAGFTAEPGSGDAPLSVTFTDTSGVGTSRTWTLTDPAGNEQVVGGGAASFVRELTMDGEYVMVLTVFNNAVRATATRTVNVAGGQLLNVAFDCVVSGRGVTCTDLSTPADQIALRSWDFGDGIGEDVGETVNYIYAADGTFTVALTVVTFDNQIGEETLQVAVSAPPGGRIDAFFTATPTSGEAPLTVSFADASTATNGITTWEWDFDGDGSVDSVNDATPIFVYENPGTYTATLTVTGPDGTDSFTRNIAVTEPVDPSVDPPAGISPADGATDIGLVPILRIGPYMGPAGSYGYTEWQIATADDFAEQFLVWRQIKAGGTDDDFLLEIPDFILESGPATYFWRVRFVTADGRSSAWAGPYRFRTIATDPADENGDGVPDDQEVDDPAAIFPDLDPNDPRILFVRSATGDGYWALEGLDNVAELIALRAFTTGGVSVPPDTEIPLGLIGFKLATLNPGDQAKVRVHFRPGAPVDSIWFAFLGIEGWQEFSGSTAVFDEAMTSVVLTLHDGGFGDLDRIENGIVVVPLSGFGKTKVTVIEGGGGGSDTCFVAAASEGNRAAIVLMGLAALACAMLRRNSRR
jgi:PKD repeat protein